MQNIGHKISRNGLDQHGLSNIQNAFWNLSAPRLYEEATRRGEAQLGQGGSLVAVTGSHTGRSPNDRFVVKEDETEADIWWGDVNRPMSEENFDKLLAKVQGHFDGRDAFVQDCYAGADETHRLAVRVVTENAWHNLFARNMFIQPADSALEDFQPQFTVLQAPSVAADPASDGTTSETFIVLNLKRRMVIIGGSAYAGEIKKSVFSVMNFLMPAKGVLPMHCSANIGPKGDTAIFFGLSGTGKTTLSADSSRTLIGDDEHGWSDQGVFNFEGGCYAKSINLTAETEPEIFAAASTFGTIVENVAMDENTRVFDFFDSTLTENGRLSYDISQIPNASMEGQGGLPQNIVMLTCDAFGVLPPISQLTPEQAMYHFLSGYTAKVAGTERGAERACRNVLPPASARRSCRATQPSMPSFCAIKWPRKTPSAGWSTPAGRGGGYGVGDRMKIAYTRAMLNAALDGRLEKVVFVEDTNFGVLVPQSCPDVPSDVLNPKNTWSDKDAYDRQAADLRQRFEKNFVQFEQHVDANVKAAAIRAAA